MARPPNSDRRGAMTAFYELRLLLEFRITMGLKGLAGLGLRGPAPGRLGYPGRHGGNAGARPGRRPRSRSAGESWPSAAVAAGLYAKERGIIRSSSRNVRSPAGHRLTVTVFRRTDKQTISLLFSLTMC